MKDIHVATSSDVVSYLIFKDITTSITSNNVLCL